MPTREKVVERYWSVCYKRVWGAKVPYPCRKSREVYKWCYHFSEGTVRHYLVYCEYEGLEGGIWYTWSGACLGIGSGRFYDKRVCFSDEIRKGRL
jgi:hypothetical protein